MLVKISKTRQNTLLKRKEATKYSRKQEKGKECFLEVSEVLNIKGFFHQSSKMSNYKIYSCTQVQIETH